MKKIIQKLKLIFFPCKENNYIAKFFSFNFLFLVALAFFVIRLISFPFYLYFPKNVFFAKIVSSDLVLLLNNERKTIGLTPLKENPQLQKAAILKAQDMMTRDYFGHKSPDGTMVWYLIKKSGYDYKMAGENLAIGFLDSEEVHQAWNNSPSHKQNLLKPEFQDIGIAVLTGEFEGGETTVVVQLFGKLKEKPVQIIPQAEAKAPEKAEISAETTQPSNAESASQTEIPAITTEPEIEIPEQEKEVSMREEVVTSGAIDSLKFNFWEFLITKYNRIAQRLIFGMATLIISVMALNIVLIMRLPFSLKPKLLLIREFAPATLLVLALIVTLGFLDRSIIIQAIPHHLEI